MPVVSVDSSSLLESLPSVYLKKHVTFSEKSNQLLEVELVFLERLATTGTPGAITRKVGYYTA